MKRVLNILCLAVAVMMGASAAFARTTARDAFVTAPSGVFMLLDKNDRLDMVDYYTSNLQSPVKNALEGKSRITAMTPEMMSVAMTPSSTYHLAVLPGASGDESDVIMLIITMSTPAKDSRVAFYSASDWKEIEPSKVFKAPELKDWLTPDGQKNRDLVESIVPFIMAEYSYDPATSTLTLTNDLGSFLAPDMFDMIREYMYPAITYKWNGKKLLPAK